jgi:hypothetical protein
VDDKLLIKLDEDLAAVLLLICLVLLLLLLVFLVLLITLEELVVFCKLDVENLELDVGFGAELVVLLDDVLVVDDVLLRLEDNVEDDCLLEDVILLEDEVILLLVDDLVEVVWMGALVDEDLLVDFTDEVFLVEVPFVLAGMGFPSTQLQSAMRL